MQSPATTVYEYLAELPEDHREAIDMIRGVILKHLPKGYEQWMKWGMAGYYVPHPIYESQLKANGGTKKKKI